MGVIIDLTGQTFGRLTVLKQCTTDNKNKNTVRSSRWVCKCSCGNVITTYSSYLKTGRVKSCGCMREERRHNLNRKHGLSNSRPFHIWSGIIQRCCNPNNNSYKNYGARGIKICDEWKNDFMAFYNWSIDNGYNDELSIDRINNDGDYCPENCRWVDKIVQANNTRSNHYVTYRNKTQTLADWCRELEIDYKFLSGRLARGETPRQVFDEIFERRKAMRDGKINQTRGKQWEQEIMDAYYKKGWQPFKIPTENDGTVFDIILLKHSSSLCIEAKHIQGDKLYFKGSGLFKKQDEINHFIRHCGTNIYIYVKSDKTGYWFTSWLKAYPIFKEKGYITKEDCIEMELN